MQVKSMIAPSVSKNCMEYRDTLQNKTWVSFQTPRQLSHSIMNEQSEFNVEQIKKDWYPGSKTIWWIIDQQVISKKGYLSLKVLHSLQRLMLGCSYIQANCTCHIIHTQLRDPFIPIKVFSSLSHTNSSFVGSSDVNCLNCTIYTYFWHALHKTRC